MIKYYSFINELIRDKFFQTETYEVVLWNTSHMARNGLLDCSKKVGKPLSV